MVLFPHAKINLGLHVLGKWKPDSTDTSAGINPPGTEYNALTAEPSEYHEIESILLPVGVYDTLELLHSADGKTRLFSGGISIPGHTNLCYIAYEVMKSRVPSLPPVHIRIHKCIPPGSGMGGGSSDAAYVLNGLNTLFRLNISMDELSGMAGQIGSDCPFFLQKNAKRVTGRGHNLNEIDMANIPACHVLIVVPPMQISTKWAYNNITPRHEATSIEQLVKLPPRQWQNQIRNHFEELVFAEHPVLRTIRDSLLEHGSFYASLTGTGSGIYGLFLSPPPKTTIRQMYPDSHVFDTTIAVS